MANTSVVGYARTTGGDQIPLRVDAQAEGTEFSLTTDVNLTVTAQDVGTYKPGSTITSIEVFGVNNINYCYVLRQGVILAWGSVNVAGVNNQELSLCAPVTLRPGDTIRVLTLAAASRNAALCVYTSSGVARIFTGTPSGAGTTNLTDLQDSSNNIGDTLQGQTIVKAMFITVDGSKIVSSGGAWIRNASGQLAGVVPASNPIKVEPMISNVLIPIALNFTASVVTNA
tara:strand:+ start:439 stop:1122 length:684 start_codon:yes stop_codon:yes gene_type:complete